MADQLVDIPFEVLAHESGSRVDLFLSRRMKRMSRSLAARVVKAGSVRREPGGDVLDKPSTRVFVGEQVVLRRKKLEEENPDDVEIEILHEDARLLVVSKPGDLIVHPTASAYHRTLIRIMRSRRNDDGLDLAHRIDKETSGVLVMVRDQEAAALVYGQFQQRTVKKSYMAVVIGVVNEDEFVIDDPMRLMPDSKTNCLMEIGGAGAQPAVTDIRVVARGPQATLVEAMPRTGRQHQIRLHLAHRGHPLLGDKLYLADEDFFTACIRGEFDDNEIRGRVGHERQALHAARLKMRHPEDDSDVEFRAPLPQDLVALGERLRIEVPEEWLTL